MKLLAPALLFLAVLPVTAASIPVPANALTLSNFQSTATVSVVDGYSSFTAFGFSTATLWDGPFGPMFMLPLGVGGSLISNSTKQAIYAQASVDFAVPGYRVTHVDLYGSAKDDGTAVGEAFGIALPSCSLAMSGSASIVSGSCNLASSGGLESGTITAWLRMYSDSEAHYQHRSEISNPLVALSVIHNPEPATFLLFGGGLIVISVLIKHIKPY